MMDRGWGRAQGEAPVKDHERGISLEVEPNVKENHISLEYAVDLLL